MGSSGDQRVCWRPWGCCAEAGGSLTGLAGRRMRSVALLCLCASASPAGTDGDDQHDPFAPVTATFPAQAAERQKLGLSFYKGLAPSTISRIAEGSLAAAQVSASHRPCAAAGLLLPSPSQRALPRSRGCAWACSSSPSTAPPSAACPSPTRSPSSARPRARWS